MTGGTKAVSFRSEDPGGFIFLKHIRTIFARYLAFGCFVINWQKHFEIVSQCVAAAMSSLVLIIVGAAVKVCRRCLFEKTKNKSTLHPAGDEGMNHFLLDSRPLLAILAIFR